MIGHCRTCREIIRFGIDKIGRVYEICPVCHEGRQPTFTRKPERPGSRLCYYEGCANGFDPTTPDEQYCSEECRRTAQEEGSERVETLFEFLHRLPHRKCDYCREYFKPLAMNQKFCQSSCRRKHSRKEFSRTMALRRAEQNAETATR